MDKYFGIYVQALLAKDASTSLQKQLKNLKELQVTVTPNIGKINSSEVSRINKELQTELKDKLKDAGKVDVKINSKPEEINKATQAVDKLGKSMSSDLLPVVRETGSGMGEFTTFTDKALNSLDGLLGVVGKVAIWSIATNAIFGTKRAINELFQSYVQTEDKLVSIARVSEGFDMDKIFQGAYASSQQYGASLMEMLDATEEIARSYNYLNEEQVLAAATAGILASTIAEMDGKDAVGTIIAVSNAYGYAIENGEKLIDIANEVDNNFSVTAQTIATAWERSAVTAKTFGVELESLTGYIAAISTVTQESGQVIGNSLKTIFSRITTMDAAIDAIKSAGVDVFDPITNEARDVQDILKDLAGTWDELTATQQQSIGVNVAGRYQLTRFLALMNNWEIAVDATTTSLNSEGGAARENAIYMDSYTAKLIQAENAQMALAESINSSSIQDIGKSFIDLKTGVTEFAAAIFRVSDATVIFGVALIGLISALSKTANGQKIVNQVTGLFITEEQRAANAALKAAQAQNQQASVITKLKNSLTLKNVALSASTKATEKYNESSKYTEMASKKLINANKHEDAGNKAKAASLRATASEYKKTAAAAQRAGAAYKTAGIAAQVAGALMQAAFTLGIGIVIGMITNGISKLINATKEATASAIESANAMADWRKELAGHEQNIKSYQDTLHSSTATTEELEAAESSLLDIQGQLIAKYGDKAKELDLVNGKYEEQIEKINELQKAEAKKQLIENAKAYNKANEKVNETKSSYEAMYGGGSYKQSSLMQDFAKEQGLSAAGKEKPGWSETTIYGKPEELIKYWYDLSEYIQDYKSDIKDAYGMSDAHLQELLDDASSNIDKLNGKYGDSIILAKENAQNVLEASDAYESFNNGLIQAAEDGVVTEEEITNLLNSQSGLKEMFEATGLTLEDLIDKYEIKSQVITDADDATIKSIQSESVLNEEIEKLNANLDNMQNAYNTVAGAIEEYNSSGYLSIDTMQQLLALDERYLATLINERGELELNEQSYRNMADAMLDEAEAAAYNQAMIDMEILLNKNNATQLEAVKKKYQNLSTRLQDTTAKYYDLAAAAATYKAQEGLTGNDTIADNIQSSLNAKLNVINKARLSLDKSVAKTVGSGSSSSASKQAAKYYEDAEKRLLSYKSAVESIDNELKRLQEQQKRNTEGSQSWFDNYNAQAQVVDRYQNSISTYISQLEVERNSTKLTSEEKQKLTNKIEDLRLEYEKLNTTLHNNIQAQKDYYAGQITDKLKLVQNIEKQRHKEALDNIKKERQAFQDQIKEQLNLMKKASAARSYEKELNELQEERLNILSQISRLEGDDSRLAKSRLQDLYEELEGVEEKIGDLNYDRDVELREDALDDLSNELDDYYDKLEEMENEKNELITSSIDNAKDSLDIATQTIQELQAELAKWSNNLANFSTWAQTFDSLIGTMPTSNIVSAMVPVNQVDAEGNVTTTQIVFNITGSSSDAQNISDTIVDNLIKSGVITTGNTQ